LAEFDYHPLYGIKYVVNFAQLDKMNKDASRNFSSVTTQQQVILRLPDDLAERVRKVISEGQQTEKTGALVIDIQQQDSQPSDKYIFIFQTEKYYALLANLPTNVETHKTFDKKIFIKTGDIGQILIVFKTERERDIAFSRTCKTVNGDYYPSGLTPPTVDIVRRKFELTRKVSGDLTIESPMIVVIQVQCSLNSNILPVWLLKISICFSPCRRSSTPLTV
jgi:TATA-binding protein-associated factor Taf7